MTTSTNEQPHTHTDRCRWDVRRARWSCPPGAAGDDADGDADGIADADDQPLVDVRDMLLVHTAMLREFRLAPAAVLGVGVGDHRRARVVGDHVQFLTGLLHHHHEGEDLLLWPKLRARTTARAATVIDEVEDQHANLDRELADVARLREAWCADPGASARDALVQHLVQLHDLLRDHLELEERALLPLAAAVLTQAEWDEVGEAGAAAMPRRELPLLFGMFAYEGDPDVLAGMLGAAPRIARTVLPVVSRRVYAARARRVHGTSRP